MNAQSILPRYVACAPEIHLEDERFERAIGALVDRINRGELDRARDLCERFRVDLEAHFAFEELVMARTGCPNAGHHRVDHATELAVLLRLLNELRGTAGPVRKEDREKSLAWLGSLRRQLDAHYRQDRTLHHHARRLAGIVENRGWQA